ncbi:L,D-transpeptidase family protein [Sphingomonas sp. URHD0057]|uniref:L,D-transpeptidase family protein n=1 Tax=Sphingomonas sp. URHD0057 TaxID=1380389 RepID=UPI00056C6528|nr:L,D-transpeptidase family protein [Sphingomonas sp. URHD0057]
MAISSKVLSGAAIAISAFAAVPLALAPSPAIAARHDPGAGAVADFYRARGGAPLWFSPRAGNAAQQLLLLLSTAQADNLKPGRYNAKGVARAIEAARRGDVQRADMVLSQSFVAFARDVDRDPGGIIYVDSDLKPTPPSATTLLNRAASAPNLADYVQNVGWMNPIYGKLRLALASRLYRSERERQLLALNLERARALPSGEGRYVIVNAPAARLYMYENGHVVDSMRVVAGRPDPIAQTPMMNAYIRYIALNPYWNSPADITAKRLAPTILKEGRAYFKNRGYELLSDWSDHPRVIDPMSIDWHAVAAGRVQARLRQKPGPANSMGKMKFMFPNAQGIWLHDTPEQEKIDEAARLQSNGCVRLEDAARFARWLFNGRPPKPQGAKPEQKVNLPSMVPVYLTYLTAVPSGTSIVYFDDFYGKDRARLGRLASL